MKDNFPDTAPVQFKQEHSQFNQARCECHACTQARLSQFERAMLQSQHAPPVAPGEQPPRLCTSRLQVDKQHDLWARCAKEDGHTGIHVNGIVQWGDGSAPPSQEHASDEAKLAVAVFDWDTMGQEVLGHDRFCSCSLGTKVGNALATAAKQAREGALEEAAKVALTPISWKKQISPNHGVANITVAGRYIAEAIRALAAQPSPQTKEEK